MSWSKVISQVALQIHRKKVYWNHILQTRQQVFRSASFCLNTTKSTGGITMSEELKTSEELAAEAETSAAETPKLPHRKNRQKPWLITLKNWKLLSNRSMKAISSPEP
jgi:hypothetical protein